MFLVLVLLSSSVEGCFVSRMRDFSFLVAYSLLSQFTHFFREDNFGSNLFLCKKQMYFCMSAFEGSPFVKKKKEALNMGLYIYWAVA